MKTTMQLVVFLLAGLVPVLGNADTTVDETRALDPNARVSVSNVSGEVRVTGWDRPEIRVTGSLGEDVRELSMEGDAQSMKVRVVLPDNRRGRMDASADLEIRLPMSADLQVETVSAEIRVAGMEGRLDLETVSGGIETDAASPEIQTESVSGAIEIRGRDRETRIEAESISGNIDIGGLSGEAKAETVSGTIRVRDVRLSRASLSTTSGSIDFQGPLLAGGRYRGEAISGSIGFQILGEADAEFEIETFSGNISNDFGPPAQKKSQYGPGRQLSFRIGEGGEPARVRLNSMSGSIRLETGGSITIDK